MANFNFNKVIIGGRLTSDPELKTTQSGISVTSFSVAVNRRGKSGEETQADFFNCTAWRGTAEFISKHFKKASSICIVGTLQNRSWTDNDGNKRYATDIVVDEASFVDSKNESQPTAAPTNYVPSAYTTPPVMEEITEDEDLPF
jgi:single-strand DNA-binding protein